MFASELTTENQNPTWSLANAAINTEPETIYLPLSDGPEGTFESLEWMARAVRGEVPPHYSGYLDDYNRWAAQKITGRLSGAIGRSEIAALFDYVSHRLKYESHPFNQQTIQDCRRTLEIGSGDCVSKSVCLATLLASFGCPVRFVAQSPDCREYTHVYVEAFLDGQWVALDPVAEDQPMGWRQPLPDGGCETPWEIF
jgi:transglutaminase-like putative cysteine protease